MIYKGSTLLDIGRNALTTHRARSEATAQNIANVGTPGYARSRAVVSAVADSPYTRLYGVEVSAYQSARSNLREQLVLGATSNYGAATQSYDISELAELAIVPPNGPSIASALDEFASTLRIASATPSDRATRRAVLTAAESLTRVVRDTDSQLQQQLELADEEVDGAVNQINSLLSRISKLNNQISGAEIDGALALSSRDQRSQLLEELAGLVDINAKEENTGALRIALTDGPVLVEAGNYHSLVASPDPSAGGRINVVVQTSTAAVQLDSSVGGTLGGTLEARDQVLTPLITALDTFAYEFAESMNSIHQTGIALDGSNGRALFDAGPTVARAASVMQVSADVFDAPDLLGFSDTVAGLPGDNSALQRLISGLQNPLPSSGVNAAGSVGDLMQQAGAAVTAAQARFESSASQLTQATTLRESVQGVSLDEELIAQAEAQRAFEAASKLIKVADEMFSTVLSLKD